MADQLIYRLRDLNKVWPAPDGEFRLCVPRLEIGQGEQISVLGQSGCGKSTLLDILAMTLEPDCGGSFEFHPQPGQGTDVGDAWRRRRMNLLAGLRGRHIGYVLQTGGLLPFVSVRDNIELPRRLFGLPEDHTVQLLAERLRIADLLARLPQTLSVGQRQRVAVARALAHEPRVVLADEPTASLDPHTAGEVLELIVDLATERGITLIVASHDWDRVTGLGLTRLQHEQIDSNNVLRSEFYT